MIPRDCKRLAEVDFPIAEVSRHAVREKKFPVPRGLPSTMHHWWARRPLASSRALLLGLLLPDPSDRMCPAGFKHGARELLLKMPGCDPGTSDESLKRALLRFIGDFADHKFATDHTYLDAGRALVAAAHGKNVAVVVDPFAGGGSIPLEALRVGCEAFASDLNPVACLILKVMLEEIPRHGPGLATKLAEAADEVREALKHELDNYHPEDQGGAVPIAYLWARTVRCDAPDCGAEIPLLRSFWLCRKRGRWKALRHQVLRCEGDSPVVDLEIFEPNSTTDVHGGTVVRAKATCLCCGAVLPPERVRSQLRGQQGGADPTLDDDGQRTGGARMIAVVTTQPGSRGRAYRTPTEDDYSAVARAQTQLAMLVEAWERIGDKRPCPVPDEPTPAGGGSGAGRAFSVQRYGMLQWGDLFTARQKLAYVLLCKHIRRLWQDDDTKPVAQLLALAMGKMVDFNCSLSQWRPSNEDIGHLFARQAIPISWDFVETDVTQGNYVGIERAVGHVCQVVANIARGVSLSGTSQLADASASPLADGSADVWFTDPPYYDAIPYSDLSDFFLVWLKRSIPGHPLLHDPFDPTNLLSPKEREAVQDETKTFRGRVKDRTFFEDAMGDAFAEGRRVLKDDGIASVVFAHKRTDGWEALLTGLIRGGWTVTGSWPIATESTTRLRARESAVLATSVHLVCRPRPADATVGDWARVLDELPQRVAKWMERLQGEGIRGADLVFACIGPALEIFSRYSSVETAEGAKVELPAYLERVWEVVGRTALAQVLGRDAAEASGGVGDLEADSRLTALFLWTHQVSDTPKEAGQSKPEGKEDANQGAARGLSLPFDVVRRFAQPMGIDLDHWTGHIISQAKGVVRLRPVVERRKELFGETSMGTVANAIEIDPMGGLQQSLFPDLDAQPLLVPRRGRALVRDRPELRGDPAANHTVLDRVHAAMLFQLGGHTTALRALIKAEQERGPDFMRLANALSALYPRGSQEKRLLDAMLLAAPK